MALNATSEIKPPTRHRANPAPTEPTLKEPPQPVATTPMPLEEAGDAAGGTLAGRSDVAAAQAANRRYNAENHVDLIQARVNGAYQAGAGALPEAQAGATNAATQGADGQGDAHAAGTVEGHKATTASLEVAEQAASINALAETNPLGAAQQLHGLVEKYGVAERAQLIEQTTPALQSMGEALYGANAQSAQSAIVYLTAVSETLHNEGQPKVAEAMASAYAAGVEAGDLSVPHDDRALKRTNLSDGLRLGMLTLLSTPHLAADVTAALARRAVGSTDRRAGELAMSTVEPLVNGLDRLAGEFESLSTGLAAQQGRLDSALKQYGPLMTDERRQQATEAFLAKNEWLYDRVDSKGLSMVTAANASARALDALNQIPNLAERFKNPAAVSSLRQRVGVMAEGLPGAAATPKGQIAMGDIVERSAAGEATLMTVVGNPAFGYDQEAKTGAFRAGASGAVSAATRRAALGQPIEPVQDELRAWSHLLPPEARGSVRTALDAMRSANTPQEREAIVASLQQSVGISLGSAIGSVGAVLGNLDEMGALEGLPALKAAKSVAGLAAMGLSLADGDISVRDALGAGETLTGLAGMGAPSSALGGIGAAVDLIGDLQDGDMLGAGSNAVALYALQTGASRLALAVTFFEIGRGIYDHVDDVNEQKDFNKSFLLSAGIDPYRMQLALDNRSGLEHAVSGITQAFPHMDRAQAIEWFLKNDGDARRAATLMVQGQAYTPHGSQ